MRIRPIVAIPNVERGLVRSGRLTCGGSIQLRTLSKTRLAPTIENSIYQVVRHCVVLGDTLMALFALPSALKNPCYLFEYSGHLCLSVTTLPAPFDQSD